VANLFRMLPSVDQALHHLGDDASLCSAPRPLLRELVNRFLDLLREEIKAGVITGEEQLAPDALLGRMACFVRSQSRPHFRRVLNATGVVIHTNLGRSLLAQSAIEAVVEACRSYSNLEFSLNTGKRGSRYSHVEDLLCRLTGAEAALVVNNNASAVLLCLETLAKGRETVVSRGQLVEIGGSFRIPDVMARSGSTLVEVGATNRTHPQDYERAITENTGLLLRVHTSNFRIIGFTRETTVEELVDIGRRHCIPVMEDLGSGCLFDLRPMGFQFEPMVQEVTAAGADVVTFSGDKVLGGPQAGIIVGRREYVDRIKRNPTNRAMRIDKMTLAALEATLRLYLDPDLARREIPTIAMITAEPDELRRKARSLARLLKRDLSSRLDVSTRPGVSRVGGGSFPERDLPTTLVTLCPRQGGAQALESLKDTLRSSEPPLIGYIEEDDFCLDPRTLRMDEFRLVSASLAQALDCMEDGSGCP